MRGKKNDINDFNAVTNVKLEGRARRNVEKLASLLGETVKSVINDMLSDTATIHDYLDNRKHKLFEQHSNDVDKLTVAMESFDYDMAAKLAGDSTVGRIVVPPAKVTVNTQ